MVNLQKRYFFYWETFTNGNIRYTDQSPNDHSPNDQSPNDQSSNDQSPNDQSPNFLKCDQSPNATNLRTTNLRMRPILVNIPDFLMFILPACCISVYLIGNEKFLLSIIFLIEKIYQETAARAALSCGSGIGSHLT
jgi:hypothetical protein